MRIHTSLCVMTNGGFLYECECPQGKGERDEEEE